MSESLTWRAPHAPAFTRAELLQVIPQIRTPAYVVSDATGRVGVGVGGGVGEGQGPAWPLLASLPALYPEWLGDRSFLEVHRRRCRPCTRSGSATEVSASCTACASPTWPAPWPTASPPPTW